MSQNPKEKLKVLREQKRDLISQVRLVEKDRNELKAQRDEKNSQVKDLFQKAKETRELRDSINEDVRLNKALRDLRQEDVSIVVKELEKMEEEMRDIGLSPSGFRKDNKHSRIAKKIQQLEIKYQTTGRMTAVEEREIVEQIEKLSKDLEQLEVVESKRDEFKTINKKLRKLRAEALSHHKTVQELAEKSQSQHELMLTQLKEAKRIRALADADHKQVLKLNEDIRAIRKEINAVAGESDKLRKSLGEETAVERKKRKIEQAKMQEVELSDKANAIYERYKSGEKLGFEEFKILISRGLLKD